MKLKITGYNNYYEVKGALTKANVQSFLKEFEQILITNNTLTISLQKLDGIDRDGISALTKLHNQALAKEKRLSIVGYGYGEAFEQLNSEENAA